MHVLRLGYCWSKIVKSTKSRLKFLFKIELIGKFKSETIAGDGFMAIGNLMN